MLGWYLCEVFSSPGLMGDNFQADDGAYEGKQKKYPEKIGRVFEDQYAYDGGAHGAYACPYCVGGAYGQALCSPDQQYHAYGEANKKAHIPPIHSGSGGFLCLAQACGEGDLE